MVLLNRFADSYPYGVSKMPPYHHHPYFDSAPPMKTDPHIAFSPYAGNYRYPSCHGCCNHGYFPGSCRPIYPQYAQPFPTFSHHGGYPQFPEPCHVPYVPEIYSMEQPIYEHNKKAPQNYEHFGYPPQPVGKGDKKSKVIEKNDEVKNYPCPVTWFPNGYLKNKDHTKPFKVNAKKLDEDPNEQRSQNQLDDDRNRFLYPIIWSPYVDEQKKGERNNHCESNDTEESVEPWPWHLRQKSGSGSLRSSTPDLEESSEVPDETIKSSCVKLNNPLEPTAVQESKETNSNKKRRRIIEVTELPGISSCNITVEKKSTHLPNATNVEIEEPQVGERRTEEVLDMNMKKYNLSDDEAAVIIQSAYRGYEMRKLNLLNKLKKLAEIREQAKDVEYRIQSLSHPQIDAKQRLILEETIMRLLLKLDTIQGLPPNLREIRKSLARELTRMQERLDFFAARVLEKFNGEVTTELVDQCTDMCDDECKGQEAKEIDFSYEHSEDSCQCQILDENKSEMTVIDQITEYLCSITESHGEDQKGEEAKDIEHKMTLNHCFSTDHEPARAFERELPELNSLAKNEKPEHEEDADQTSPKSVLVFPENGIPAGHRLVSDDSESETPTEVEVEGPGGTLFSPIVAGVSEATGLIVKGDHELIKDNMELRALVEKLIEATKEQSCVISDLNRRIHSLEENLSVKKKHVKGKPPKSRNEHAHQINDQPDQEIPTLSLTKALSSGITDLNRRMHTLEKKLSVNRKAMRGKRPKSRMEHAREVYGQFDQGENDCSAQEEPMVSWMKGCVAEIKSIDDIYDQFDQEEYYYQSP